MATTRYGVEVHPGDPSIMDIPATITNISQTLGAKLVRMDYSPPDPNGVINPNNGYDYSYIPEANAAGIRFILITPYPKATPDAAYVAAYAAYCAAGAAAHPGQIWELDNEPNNALPLRQAQLTPAQYVALMQATIPAIRAADPTATIIMGGTAGVDYGWINACSLLWSLVDGIGIHPYPPPPGWWNQIFPPKGTTTINNLRGVIINLEAHTGRPAYVTEWGESPQSPAHIQQAVAQVDGYTPVFNLYQYDSFGDPAGGPTFGIESTPAFAAYANAIKGK